MSRQNKVNPGTYTQRGRLTQDDAARELRKQSAVGSQHTWQPVNTRKKPVLQPAAKAAPSNAKGQAAKAKTTGTRKSKKTTANTKTGKAKPTAMKRTATKTTRKTVPVRRVGAGGAAPRRTTKR